MDLWPDKLSNCQFVELSCVELSFRCVSLEIISFRRRTSEGKQFSMCNLFKNINLDIKQGQRFYFLCPCSFICDLILRLIYNLLATRLCFGEKFFIWRRKYIDKSRKKVYTIYIHNIWRCNYDYFTKMG